MRPATRPYILGTAGHVDHGKSSIVRALTGTDPDRLPEEKARGITIDLGFANMVLPHGAEEYHVGIIDVPGHEDFVKNMVSGVGSLDAALLVVAADDGWMPQTEEHLQILNYLGVTAGVIALNKIDLAIDEAAAIAQVRDRLRGTPLAEAPIVPTSVRSGRGLLELKERIAEVLSRTPPPVDVGKPRLPVDRVFSLRGVGTVVTGTLTGGCLQRGQSVVIQPGGKPIRIRSMQTHGDEVEIALPGSRVALNLPDVQPSHGRGTDGEVHGSTIARSHVVTTLGLGSVAQVVDVLLWRSGREPQAPPLRNGAKVQLHHGSGVTRCRLRLVGISALEPGEQALARVVLELPMFALVGDRFVIRDGPGQHTLAGGVILDMCPPRPNRSLRRDPRALALLQCRSLTPADAGVFVASQVERDGFVARALLLSESRHSATEIEKGIADLVKSETIVDWGAALADPAAYRKVYELVLRRVDDHHQEHPEQLGLPLTDARSVAEEKLPAIAGAGIRNMIVEGILGGLCRSELARTNAVLHRRSHRPALPPRLRPAGAKIRSILAESLLQPPSRKELCSSDLAAQALRFLVAGGEVMELGPEVVISAEAYAHATDIVRDRLKVCEAATVSELKECLGSTRRVIVPLLERFDREGITRRVGDRRMLRASSLGAEAASTIDAGR